MKPEPQRYYLIHAKLYGVWFNMIDRCVNPKNKSWRSYGKKGVSVCEEWLNDFIPFYNWAMANGYKEGLQIDKDIKGNGKLYSPETCLWVTEEDNLAHQGKQYKTYSYNGELYNLTELAKISGKCWTTLHSRINEKGMTVEDAVDGILGKNPFRESTKKIMGSTKIKRFSRAGMK